MSTMLDGESYLGRVMIRPLSKSGDIKIYLWPMRCLKSGIGGPTFGVDVNGEEILRYDAHGPGGHWHKGGYDKLGAGGSHVEFPDDARDVKSQLNWSLTNLQEQTTQLLSEAGYGDAAASFDAELAEAASKDILAHLESEGDLRPRAIEQGLVKS